MDNAALLEFLSSPEFINASTNANRLVSKLRTAVQNKELYETHQILRTINFRFIGYKEKVTVLSNLLYEGAIYLLKLHEDVSGQDIATLFLEATAKCLETYRDEGGEEAKSSLDNSSKSYHVTNGTKDLEISQKVADLVSRLPETEIGRARYIADTLKILTPKLLNRTILHDVIANKSWVEKEYSISRYHYLHCANLENAQDVAKFLVEYQQSMSGSSTELDLFITHFIFQFLCLQTPIEANKALNQKGSLRGNSSVFRHFSRNTIKTICEKIFSTYTLQHPSLSQVSVPFTSFPLLNFTYFIISILDSNKDETTFTMLRDIYKVTLARDSSLQNYLNRIGTLYFGILDPSKQRQGGGFFNNILMSLLEGNEEGEEESNHEANDFSSCDELD